MKARVVTFFAVVVLAALVGSQPAGAQAAAAASPEYDLLLKGGHVIDARNNIDTLMDVAIQDGKIARVARAIPAGRAIKTVNVTGMYVVPGLVDIHTHVYAGTGEKNSYAGDLSVYPDGF
ncbi:MAG TPA: amidohydrolase/deacetylase family metallohydrolase, partial [Acidobacteriaceae bacterium]|nr:amidohydrolase/deacetylase family metallohydrolase [Acidobacteriaceae bacterium]